MITKAKTNLVLRGLFYYMLAKLIVSGRHESMSRVSLGKSEITAQLCPVLQHTVSCSPGGGRLGSIAQHEAARGRTYRPWSA